MNLGWIDHLVAAGEELTAVGVAKVFGVAFGFVAAAILIALGCAEDTYDSDTFYGFVDAENAKAEAAADTDA